MTSTAPSLKGLKALVFDVFGTLVDWRSSIARESRAVFAPLGIEVDGLVFADAWRARYQPTMEEVRSGRVPFSKLDVLHRHGLETVLEQLQIRGLDEAAKQHLNLAWHRLDAWPDTPPGLALLRRQFLLAPCSNGNVSLMADLARRNGIVWDAILGAEFARAYKPQPEVYLAAAAAFDCAPHEIAMVAAHSSDLAAAAKVGLRTAHIARPDEKGPGNGEAAPTVPVDIAASSIVELAHLLEQRM